LPLTFVHERGIDLGSSALVGTTAAHRALARALGLTLLPPC
jgi:hypothetical protein